MTELFSTRINIHTLFHIKIQTMRDIVTFFHLNESKTESKMKYWFGQPLALPLGPYYPSGYNTWPIIPPRRKDTAHLLNPIKNFW